MILTSVRLPSGGTTLASVLPVESVISATWFCLISPGLGTVAVA
ncbi:Uncharacterised protein [Mycobacteroides abscessus subsp. abscessus]|nr:Uncharacterised protein [Mycobacteroides abscessus subsp. abscessus]